MTYEGAKSSVGAYLAILGASVGVVAFIIGFGELIGYTPRLLTGSIIDRTGRYWTLMFIGYGINLVAVPMLALSGNWISASALIIVERAGKAIRAPARDAMISYASVDIGRGWSFGVHKALSSIGGILGPSVIAIVLILNGSYEVGFVLLAIPALLSLVILALTFKRFPHPRQMEIESQEPRGKKLSRTFWLYSMGAALIAAGFIDFPVMAYHFETTSLGLLWIPVFYAAANATSAMSALLFGRLYDYRGMKILVISILSVAVFPLLVFYGDFTFILLGVMLWGMGVGVQDSIMRGVVAQITPISRRGSAYGYYSMFFGISWFLGTVFMGIVYSISIPLMIGFSILTQLTAVFLLLRLTRAIDVSNEGITNKNKDSAFKATNPK